MEENSKTVTPEAGEVQEVPKGITRKLYHMGQVVLAIGQNESDFDKKKKYFDEIYHELMKEADEIKSLMEGLYDNPLPEKLANICADIDANFDEASSLHLDAIDLILEYMESGNEEKISDALETLKKGGNLLEKADSLVKIMAEESEKVQGVNMNIEL